VLVSQEAPNPLASGEAVADIWTPGKPANAKWTAFINSQVAQFKQLNGAVLWRPFVEVNGNHFGSAFTPAQNVSLFQYTHDYAISQGLNNVLWVFNLNYWDPNRLASQYYPGSNYVDIVSLDSYPPDSNSDNVYNFYLTTGKPIMFAEAGVNGNGAAYSGNNSTMLATVKSSFPKAFAVMVWCQTWALMDQGGEDAFMSDPAIITLSDVPAAFR
ncbi:MAG: glycosyl hydrolase, partial [Steroidobacteraceae bacterium]